MSNVQARLDQKVRDLPQSPGVYLFKDAEEKVIYVGKALDLKKRVSSYFTRPGIHSPKIAVLMNRIHDLEVIETQTEVDALLLEAQLIHKYEPRYNTLQKDDKSFPLLKLTGDRFPRLVVTRHRAKSSAERKASY